MTLKLCLRCKIKKEKSEFSKDNSRKDKLRPYCKLCCKFYTCAWRKINQHKIKSYDKSYYRKNKKEYKRRQQTFREHSTEKYLVGSARRRARRKGVEFSLTFKDIIIPKVCPILGIKLKTQKDIAKNNSPSIDRIDNTKGYTPDNVLVISKRANELKRDASLEELQQLASFYKGYTK